MASLSTDPRELAQHLASLSIDPRELARQMSLATTISGTPEEIIDEKNSSSGSDDSKLSRANSCSNGKEALGAAEPPHLPDEESLQGVQEEKDVVDLEAVHPMASNRPIYSVFGVHQKRFIIFMAAFAGLFSTLSANTYFPAINSLSSDLHVSNELINLTLTSYMIFQGLAPMIYGDLADMTGRRPAYALGFVIYIAANIGLALQKSYAALFILRCLQSSGSSGTIALGYGVVADVSSTAERGIYMGFVVSGTMVGPAFGPFLGGVLSQFLGWRWIFWFLVILIAAFLVPFLVAFPETARHIVGNGSIPPQWWNVSVLGYLKARTNHRQDLATAQITENPKISKNHANKRLKWPNPLKVLRIVTEKDVAIILIYNALVYTAYYCVITSLPNLLGEIYEFNDLQIGLGFIPFGTGCIVASLLCGRLIDINYKRIAKANNFTIDHKRGDDLRDFPIEKARIQVMSPFLAVGIVALVAYGWVLHFEAPLAVPLVLLFIISLCLVGSFHVMCLILVDLYPESPATATAANNLARCLLGAGGTAVVAPMINTMGRGWCFTLIAAILTLTSPIIWIELKWGASWREERRVRVEGQKCK